MVYTVRFLTRGTDFDLFRRHQSGPCNGYHRRRALIKEIQPDVMLKEKRQTGTLTGNVFVHSP